MITSKTSSITIDGTTMDILQWPLQPLRTPEGPAGEGREPSILRREHRNPELQGCWADCAASVHVHKY